MKSDENVNLAGLEDRGINCILNVRVAANVDLLEVDGEVALGREPRDSRDIASRCWRMSLEGSLMRGN
jgi:hypothetical protein